MLASYRTIAGTRHFGWQFVPNKERLGGAMLITRWLAWLASAQDAVCMDMYALAEAMLAGLVGVSPGRCVYGHLCVGYEVMDPATCFLYRPMFITRWPIKHKVCRLRR